MESGLQTAGSRHRAECSGRKVKHIGSQRSMNYIYRDRGTNWISDGQIYRGKKIQFVPDRSSRARLPSPLEQPFRRAPRTGARCRSALTRAFRPTFSFCMALRASLTEFTTFTMLIWLSDSSCNTHTREKRECTFIFMNNVLVPNVYQTIQYVYLAVGIVLNSQEATHACAGPNLQGRSRHWHILLVIFFCAWVASGRNVNEQNDLFQETRKTFLSQPKQQGKYMISSSPSAVYQSAFVSPPVINNHIISFQTPLWELC